MTDEAIVVHFSEGDLAGAKCDRTKHCVDSGSKWFEDVTCPVCLSIIRALCDRKLKEIDGDD